MDSPAPPGPAPLRGRLLPRAGLALAGALLALGAAEVALRLAREPRAYDPSLLLDRELGFRKRPGLEHEERDERGAFSFRLNGAGFRRRELPREAAKSGPRLLFVGDSFLFALAVRDEELVSAVTERLLAERGIAAEAYDLGCQDYGTAQELALLRRHAPLVRPDAVVLLLFPGNDLANNCLELAGRALGNDGDYWRPYLEPDGEGLRFAHPLRAFLRNHLRLFGELELALLAAAETRGWSWPTMWGDLERGRVGNAVLREPPPGDDWDAAWRRTERCLALFRDEVRALGAELLVLVVPQRNQVQREGFNRGLYASSDAAEIDWNYPERRLQAFFAREGIDAWPLLDDLRAAIAADPEPVYAQDFHFSGRAHALAARRVADWFAALRSGAAPPAPAPASGAPVDLLAAERCLSLLDFVRAPRFEFLGDGFGLWRPDWNGQGPGLPMSARVSLVLRVDRGALVVRGMIPRATAALPLTLALELDGAPLARTLTVEDEGPFELRVQEDELPPDLPPRIELTLAASTSGGQPRGSRWVAILRSVGFEE